MPSLWRFLEVSVHICRLQHNAEMCSWPSQRSLSSWECPCLKTEMAWNSTGSVKWTRETYKMQQANSLFSIEERQSENVARRGREVIKGHWWCQTVSLKGISPQGAMFWGIKNSATQTGSFRWKDLLNSLAMRQHLNCRGTLCPGLSSRKDGHRDSHSLQLDIHKARFGRPSCNPD